MPDLGKAYVQIVPSADGIKDMIEKELGATGKKSGESFASAFGGALGGIAKAAATAVAAATTAVGVFAADSVKVGEEFDKSMSQVAATMGTTVDQIVELRDFALEMGAGTAFSATQAAGALNYMALAGYDAETSMAMLPNVLNLAAAGSMGLASASDMITDAQSALGLSLEQTSAMVDQMAKASSKTNTSVEQLGEAILTVGGTAQYMAGGTAELNSVLGVLANNGIKGSEGGTHLRNMLLNLSSPTKDATKLLDSLGVQIFDAEGNMRSFTEIFPELNAAMDSFTDQERLDAMSTLFNSRDIASATALLGTTTERWEELGEAITNSAGAAEAMANTQLDNLAGDITLFKSALEGAKIAVSDELTPSLREFVQFGASAISGLTEAFKEDGLSGAMSSLGTAISDGLAMVISKLPDFVNAGVELLSALGAGIVESFPLILDAALQIVSMVSETILENLPEIIRTGLELLVALARGIAENLETLIPAVIEAVLEIVDILTEPETQQMLVEAAVELIAAIAKGLIRALPSLLEKVPEILLNLGRAFTEQSYLLEEAWEEIINRIKEKIDDLIQSALNWGKDLVNSFIQGIKDKIQHVIDTVRDLAQTVRDYLGFSEPDKGPLSDFHTFAPDMIELFARGIRDNERLITDQIASSFDVGTQMIDYGFTGARMPQFQTQTYTEQSGGGTPPPIVLDVTMLLDGTALARQQFSYNNAEAAMRGAAFIG